MNRDEITAEILAALKEVAPELDAGTLDPARNFRDQFEFDSIDFLDLVLKLEKRLAIKLPQAHYPQLSSLNGALDYIDSATAARP